MLTLHVIYDMYAADFGHHGGYCTFEVLIRKFGMSGDSALAEIAEIDVSDERTTPQSDGLRAIGEGFLHIVEDDHENLRIQSYIYDALYEWCKARL